jgi:hypothetical protein
MKWIYVVLFAGLQASAQSDKDSIVVPLGGNAWPNPDGSSTVYVRMKHAGGVQVRQSNGTERRLFVKDTGYLPIRVEGDGVKSITLKGAAVADAAYVPNDEGNFFYWGRRGPSVHLNYEVDKNVHAEYFYNEVTVPPGQDVEGSYFMADGFSVGYFGMQVNSSTERHILFSVWSPFSTDDPAAIPDSQKVVLLKKGAGVHAGEFGDEGSGGQSYLNYMWKPGLTYRFLLRAQHIEKNITVFTAWFYPPEEGKWRLIASFRRPQTHTWLVGLHSFLENFLPETGDRSRYALYDHQWVRTTEGKWMPLHRAFFTGDNTAMKGYRMDYAGGVKGDAFFLQNCGFFPGYTPLDSWWRRPSGAGEVAPDIEMAGLEQ